MSFSWDVGVSTCEAEHVGAHKHRVVITQVVHGDHQPLVHEAQVHLWVHLVAAPHRGGLEKFTRGNQS